MAEKIMVGLQTIPALTVIANISNTAQPPSSTSVADLLSNPNDTAGIRGAIKKQSTLPGVPTFAMLGDSITDQNSRNIQPPAATPSRAWYGDGFGTWFRILSNQRINLPVENDFGVSGDTFQQMFARIADVIAVKPDYCTLLGGTNNFAVNTYEEIKAAYVQCVNGLLNAGIAPVILPAPPRAGSAMTTQQLHLQQRFTQFQRSHCAKNSIIFVDYLATATDQTSLINNPLPNMIKTDNVHPTSTLGYWMGKTLNDTMQPYLPPQIFGFMSNIDYFSVDNPTGNLLYSGTSNRALLAGTGGTQTVSTNLTYSGNLAAGVTFIRSGTSVATVTLTKENPRTDRVSGERQIVQIAAASGGAADEVYNLRLSPTFADIAVGDWYYGQASVEITGAPVNCWGLELYVLETRPSNSQTAIDLGVRDFGHGFLPTETWKGILKTPPIQKTADATAIQMNVRARLKTDTGAASITYKVGDFILRKVDTDLI